MKRRTMIGGVVAVAGAAAAGLYRFTDLFVKHYAPTPYDDLLVQLVDREQAVKLGAKMTGGGNTAALSAQLRTTLKDGLAAAAAADAAAGRVVEADGWVVPQSLAQLAMLAAKV